MLGIQNREQGYSTSGAQSAEETLTEYWKNYLFGC